MPILNRIKSFLSSPQGRAMTDEGIRRVRSRGAGGRRPAHGAAPGHARGRAGGLLSLLRRR